ncbi:hypothetical protein H4N54_16290 [Limnospira fusiformis KN01]|uniref:hypothetical protein n=1 Tax=Limnospira TaxID=2596745 RepID=UPI001658BDB4|nr:MULTISPECIES: hypothetical protein [Limnospira]MDT9201252.1 hypothetical protein [Limnospira sp. PMC 1042.18]ULB44015.1 hypothetical protein H4N54_16290 [Limnospira fusiformis KN01]
MLEFKTILHNGIINIPSQYPSQWEGKIIRVIVLETEEGTESAIEENPLKGSIIFEDDLIAPIEQGWESF